MRGTGVLERLRAGPLWPAPLLVITAGSLVIVAPMLRPGYVLDHDMVITPWMPVNAASVGLSTALPRAVPSDLVVALAGHVVPGQIVQKAVLLLLLLAAGLGAARLAPGGAMARSATGIAYLWTPFLAERMLLGQWAVLIGYAALPWLVLAADAAATGGRQAWARLVAVLGFASLGGAPAWLLAAITTPVVIAWRSPRPSAVRRTASCLGALAVFALPWLLPAVLRPGGVRADLAGATVFAPRADTPLGVVASIVTGGGVWSADAVPNGRDTVVGALGALVIIVVAARGWPILRRNAWVAPLALVGVVTLGVVLVSAWHPAAHAIARLPGGSLIRDTQRLLAIWVLLIALGFGAGISWISSRARTVAILCAALPIVVLPSVAWGLSNRLVPVAYPGDFAHVRQVLAADPRPGAVAVLPFETYRQFPWNGKRISLDPVPRTVHRTVVTSSDLPVRVGAHVVVVRGEDRLADQVAAMLTTQSASSLGSLGIRWVVVDAPIGSDLVAGLRPVFHGAAVSLYEVPDVSADRARNPAEGLVAPSVPVIAADIAAVATLLAACCVAVSGRVKWLLGSASRT